MTPAQTLKEAEATAKREALESLMAQHLKAERIEFEQQAAFWPGRKWRLDFLIGRYSSKALAIEVHGGTWSGGRHVTGKGIEADCEKAAHAVIAGIRLIPVTGDQVKSGQAIAWIKQAMGAVA